MWFFLILCVPYISAWESSLAPFITKCKQEDGKCLKESAIKALPIFAEGLPNLHMESLDPLKIKEVNATKSGLEITVTDIAVTGLKDCEVREIMRDTKKGKVFLKLRCSVLATGQYQMKGLLPLFNLFANGALISNINDFDISVFIDYKTVEKNGKMHYKVSTWNYEYELIGKSSIRLENLFRDYEILGESTSLILESQGNAPIVEMGTPLIRAVCQKVEVNVDRFLEKVPIDDLVLE